MFKHQGWIRGGGLVFTISTVKSSKRFIQKSEFWLSSCIWSLNSVLTLNKPALILITVTGPGVWLCACVYPMSRADGLVSGPRASAEVELLDGETFVIETDVICPTGCPVLHISQICVSVNQHMSTAEKKPNLFSHLH